MPNHESLNLEPPPRTSIDDPGAHELESSDSDDHFSDAQSGGAHSPISPVPLTRVEKVDSEPSYGEVPGTDAYNMRVGDAQPDQIAVIPGDDSTKPKSPPIDRPSTPGGHPIPITVVERVDASSVTSGGLPASSSHHVHKADAEPDVILDSSEAQGISPEALRSRISSNAGDMPIPVTKVEKVDSIPNHGEVPGTDAYKMRKEDAIPDIVEEVGDVPGSPTSHVARSPTINYARRKSSVGKAVEEYNESEDGDDDADFGDDFDDFEEGGDDAEFDDFDGGFQEAEKVPIPQSQSLPLVAPSFPVLNFDNLDTPEEVMAATEPYVEAIFPIDTIDTSKFQPAPHDNPIFTTQRSASLWSQLVAPPPLQPPNWIRSRIRRLFLVSLGVPVDLDEILPASKQKKLILPSIHLVKTSSSPRNSTDSRGGGSISRLKQGDGNASSTSLDSQGKPSHSKRRKGPPPAPELDLVYARQLCTITDEALNGLTMEELREHVQKLESMQGTAKEVLEYWTKRTDEKIGDREAFEGVIENLVKHARKVRK